MLRLNKCNKLVQVIKCHSNVEFFVRNSTMSRKTIVLGIETSCDDTGCAVVDSMGNILGEALYSQNIHIRYGGVNPINASELHRENIACTVNDALRNAGLHINQIHNIAVTFEPGLLMSLTVGVKYARFLARKYHKPLIPIHHMKAHALVARMFYQIPYPFLTLLISGGHCILAVAQDVDNFLLLGQTVDNAPGEVMDKAARRMKLKNIPTYSNKTGGRAIELAAKNATDPNMFSFPIPLVRTRDCNFSFSGLKDSLIRKLLKKELEHGIMGDEIIPEVNNLCASFQIIIAKHLAHRLKRAILYCEYKKLLMSNNKAIVVSGGVACNDFIYEHLHNICKELGYSLLRPPHKVCTDNGIMIAWNGIEKIKSKANIVSSLSSSDVNPVSPIGENMISHVRDANLAVKVPKLKYI